ncbi:MAG: hypothetical protein DKT66_06615 [Candidatus Melainabacteria bacterium]|nr:MAG: hypothetical protein DKT66_06615 [Candidatus Melainabacteria bacterium]
MRVGILIIGSLFWRENRQQWRTENLLEDLAFPVRAPIRYGRLSSSNTYTMTFSRAAPFGEALVLPCRREVSDIDDLKHEARLLWGAEVNAHATESVSSDWGCVALLSNGSEKAAVITNHWSEFVSAIPNYGRISHAAGEEKIVESGILQFSWESVFAQERSSSTKLDLILATANDPTIDQSMQIYASPQTIADAWNTHRNAVEYFRNNRESRIKTFQDSEIIEHLYKEWEKS